MSNDPTHDNVLVLKDKVEDPLTIPAMETRPTDTQPDEPEAQVWAYQGVHGGSGVTSLVVQTAYELATMHKRVDGTDPQVLLIDLDFERGGCAVYLDIQPNLRVEELNAASGRMDPELAETFIQKFSKNISTIIAEGELGGNDLITPHALLSCGRFASADVRQPLFFQQLRDGSDNRSVFAPIHINRQKKRPSAHRRNYAVSEWVDVAPQAYRHGQEFPST